eukprot:XP_011680561.1 PREDICTED: uncharacterized protein LOC105445997 isoform X1 [Strongylocentrotus purpuratus]
MTCLRTCIKQHKYKASSLKNKYTLRRLLTAYQTQFKLKELIMSDEHRRGAIYVHPSDMASLKSSDKIRIKSKASIKTLDEQERRSKSTPPTTGASRRESMAAGGRRGSTMGGKGPAKGRRGSCHPGDGAQNRRGSRLDDTSYQPQRRKKKSDEPEPALTKEQVEAFQEVFNLFDSNGGGTIDADELQLVLGSVDIHLPAQDIRDVLEGIDKDGSGEIDFEEFLQLMTNTEKFLETCAASHDEHPEDEEDAVLVGGRETVLFDALTKFMKTSALTQMDVLQRYFNTKYKRAQAPHVVMHYAAGARLIGLTEKQLVQHLDRLQASNEDSDYKSPYAEPLRIMLAPLLNVRKKKKRRKDESVEDIQEERPRLTGKIRIRIHFKSEDEKLAKVEENKKEEELASQPIYFISPSMPFPSSTPCFPFFSICFSSSKFFASCS